MIERVIVRAQRLSEVKPGGSDKRTRTQKEDEETAAEGAMAVGGWQVEQRGKEMRKGRMRFKS